MKIFLLLVCFTLCLITAVVTAAIYKNQVVRPLEAEILALSSICGAYLICCFVFYCGHRAKAKSQDSDPEDSVTDLASNPGRGFPMVTARNVANLLARKKMTSVTCKAKKAGKWRDRKQKR